MDYLFLILRWLHIISSIIVVGGVFYYRIAVLPAIESLPDAQRDSLTAGMRRNWAMLARLAILLLLVTGLTNMILVPKNYDFAEEGRKAFNILIGIKFLLALPIFFIVDMLNGRSATAQRFRQKSRMWLNLAVFLSIVVIVIGGYVRFIPRTPKGSEAITPPAEMATAQAAGRVKVSLTELRRTRAQNFAPAVG
jgi:uncharacterized membrane protein